MIKKKDKEYFIIIMEIEKLEIILMGKKKGSILYYMLMEVFHQKNRLQWKSLLGHFH